jgi:hypothetical protein
MDQIHISELEKSLRVEVAGNFCALGVIPVADSMHELVDKYIDFVKESPTRKFHSFEYILHCLLYAREFNFAQKPLATAALLFHTAGYYPGDKKSVRRSCEIAISFYSSEYTVELIRLIKSAQTEESLTKRYGDDRDCIGDVVNYFYGTTDYESFKKIWAQILLEFQGAGYPPKKFKTFSKLRLKKMLRFAQSCGVYHTLPFALKYNRQALDNIERMFADL